MATIDFTNADTTRVLTHPSFDRPPVKNAKGPGRKKGVISLDVARRARREQPPAAVAPAPQTQYEDFVVMQALRILDGRLGSPGACLSSPTAVKQFLRLRLAGREREAFAVVFLDTQNRVIAFEVLFEGCLTQTTVYPGVVARRALQHNASAVILAHNHPSGSLVPSEADEHMTIALRAALTLVGVTVLDHIVVGRGGATSFAELGLLQADRSE